MDQRKLPERDWKALRPIQEKALARYCRRVLDEVRRLIDDGGPDGSDYERYGAVYRAVSEGDRKLGRMFDGFRRSTAFLQLALWVAEGMVDESELATLSDGTREVVRDLLAIRECSKGKSSG